MKRSVSIVAGALVALAAGWSAGCSESSSTAEAPRIEGKTPAQYREDNERQSGQAVEGKTSKARGKARSTRD